MILTSGTKIRDMHFVNVWIDLDFVYDASGKLVGVDHGDEHYFYLRDVTGNIIGIVDRNGAYIVKYFYDAWGNILNEDVIRSCAVSLLNPFKYKGYLCDNETGWYYLKTRYYAPEICRFISPDSIAFIQPKKLGGLNLYAYCNNNPVLYADPSGNSLTSFCKKN